MSYATFKHVNDGDWFHGGCRIGTIIVAPKLIATMFGKQRLARSHGDGGGKVHRTYILRADYQLFPEYVSIYDYKLGRLDKVWESDTPTKLHIGGNFTRDEDVRNVIRALGDFIGHGCIVAVDE